MCFITCISATLVMWQYSSLRCDTQRSAVCAVDTTKTVLSYVLQCVTHLSLQCADADLCSQRCASRVSASQMLQEVAKCSKSTWNYILFLMLLLKVYEVKQCLVWRHLPVTQQHQLNHFQTSVKFWRRVRYKKSSNVSFLKVGQSE